MENFLLILYIYLLLNPYYIILYYIFSLPLPLSPLSPSFSPPSLSLLSSLPLSLRLCHSPYPLSPKQAADSHDYLLEHLYPTALLLSDDRVAEVRQSATELVRNERICIVMLHVDCKVF